MNTHASTTKSISKYNETYNYSQSVTVSPHQLFIMKNLKDFIGAYLPIASLTAAHNRKTVKLQNTNM